MRRRSSTAELALFGGILVLLGAFFVYPLTDVVWQSFVSGGRFSLGLFRILLGDPLQWECIGNSALIALATTLVTLGAGVAVAAAIARMEFPGRQWFTGLLLVPMVMPPFVGAIGLKQLFARYGAVNLLLQKVGILSAQSPIEWFSAGLTGIVILQVLHLYPIMYLNVAASLAAIDPSLEEASESLGASPFRRFWNVTMPLALPGCFAGSVIVFIWSFTDLGTPLILNFTRVVPVQIYNMRTDFQTSRTVFPLVLLVVAMTTGFFYVGRRFFGSMRHDMTPHGGTSAVLRRPRPIVAVLAVVFLSLVVVAALLPHLSVLAMSVASRWYMTVLPESTTLEHFRAIFAQRETWWSVRNSLFFATASTGADILLGTAIVYLLTRSGVGSRGLLDGLSMMPLAVPGLIVAFGYLSAFTGTALDPRENPTALLIAAYAVRRLPYMVRALYAGFASVSVSLEEAARNLGAGSLRTLWQITFPLVRPSLIAGSILCFAFAMLEVSDSLVLAMKEGFYPITKEIWELVTRLQDGPSIASALGVLGMGMLAASFLVSGRVLGRRLGQLFRV